MTPEQQKVLTWLGSRDTGRSSKALAFELLGVAYDDASFAPVDPADLGRCLRLIRLAPAVRACVDRLARKYKGWAKAAAVWDEIADSMEDEVGIDWENGQSAPRTYRLMKEAGL